MKTLIPLIMMLFIGSQFVDAQKYSTLDLSQITPTDESLDKFIQLTDDESVVVYNHIKTSMLASEEKISLSIKIDGSTQSMILENRTEYLDRNIQVGEEKFKGSFVTYSSELPGIQVHAIQLHDQSVYINVLSKSSKIIIQANELDLEDGNSFAKSIRVSKKEVKESSAEEIECGMCNSGEFHSPNIHRRDSRLLGGCGTTEFTVSVGMACDFSYFTNRGNEVNNAVNDMVFSFVIARQQYAQCDMNVVLELGDILVETGRAQLFPIPFCPFRPSKIDAYKYNLDFAAHPAKPNGDVATLWTDHDILAFCVSKAAGMAISIGGVCGFGNTNVCEGFHAGISGGLLQAHEIGHNLGIGTNHGNINGNFFYGDLVAGTPFPFPWHSSTVQTMHSTMINKNCVEKTEYCCTEFRNIYLCGEETEFCTTWDNCGGILRILDGVGPVIDGIDNCGEIRPGGSQTFTISQFTEGLNCEFNRDIFKVVNCEGQRPVYNSPPFGMHEICLYDVEEFCYEFTCVQSWEVIHNSNFFVSTDGDRICLTSSGRGRTGVSTLRLRPHYACGGTGEWLNWSINRIDCEGGEQGGIKSNQLVIDEMMNATSDISCFPNPAQKELNIESSQPISSVKIFDVNGILQLQTKESKGVNVSNISKGLKFVHVHHANNTSEVIKVLLVD